MLAEAAHSVADSFNQIFLKVSLSSSERPPDAEHPFGHGKDRFFWSFLAAVMIFLSGAAFSVVHGVLEVVGQATPESGGWKFAYGVLAYAFFAEGTSLARAVRQLQAEARAKQQPLRRYIRDSPNITTKTVVFEDAAAVIGVVLACLGVALYRATGEAAADGSASIAIGILLACIAVEIGASSRDLLLGHGAPPGQVERLLRTMESFPEVKDVLQLRTMYLHPESLLVAAKIDFVEGLDADRIEQVSNEIEEALRQAVPEVSEVFLDPTPRRATASDHGAVSSAAMRTRSWHGRAPSCDGRTGKTLDYEAFIARVESETRAPREEAERAVRATLQTLAERISGGEARDIAEQLPPELGPLLHDGSRAEPFDLGEFVRRVAEREQVTQEIAAEHARAVFAALGSALSPDELHDLASELPRDFGDLLVAAGESQRTASSRSAAVGAEEFLERVAARADLDRDRAWQATDAVLEALAERISGGEVDDLESELPSEFHAPLERGKAQSHGAARKLSLQQFVRGIAEREGVTPEEAHVHARAVFATLREVISAKEFGDVSAQLPDEYAALLAR